MWPAANNFAQTCTLVSSSVALFLNIVLGLIIIFCSNQQLGKYKILLLVFVIVEVLFEFGELVLFPVIQGTRNYYNVYARNTFTSYWFSQFSLICIHSIVPQVSIVLAFSFLYRYAIVCSPGLVKWFTNPKKRLIFPSICLLTFLDCGGCVWFFMQPSEEKEAQLKGSLALQGLNMSERAYISLKVYNTDRSMTLEGIIQSACFNPIYFVCFTVYGYTTMRIMKFFKTESIHLSEQNLHSQKQLFYMLMFQTVTPLLTLVLPITIGVVLSLLSLDVGLFNQYISIITSSAALIDPLIIFYFIADYRRAIVNFFFKRSSTGAVSDTTLSFIKSDNQNVSVNAT